MRTRLLLLSSILLLSLQSLFTPSQAQAFIARHYTLQEVLAESSNILFGTVASVNPKRMTAKVEVKENLKGESKFEEIKINLSTGQGNFPDKMMKKFKVGKPIIVFYKMEGQRIPSLGHVDGTWFQTFAQDRSDKSRVWWNFTHIEIYMHRTYKGSTPDFQKLVRDTLAGRAKPDNATTSVVQSLAEAPAGAVRVLVLSGNRYNVEFRTLSALSPVAEHQTVYQRTRDRNLPTLDYADILWLGQGEICEDKYRLTNEHENRIKAFVKDGGVVIVSGQDSDDDRPCSTGWIPEPMKGVERLGRSDFEPTRAADTLFSEPNEIQFGDVFLDDTWTDWSDKYTILATTNSGKEIAFATLKYGKGLYLITGLQNETSANVFINYQIIENLIHFAVEWLNDKS